MELVYVDGNATLQLSDDLLWADEHAWTAATAHVEYLLTGALLIETGARQAGRPITLVGTLDMAWVTRSTLQQLHAWADVPGRQFELSFVDGRRFIVAFRHADGAIEAEPVLGFPARSSNDWYRVTLRFIAT